MAIDALLLLQHSDVRALAADGVRWSDLPLVCIDPGILADALAAGLPADRLDYRPLQVERRFLARAATEALSRALVLDQALAREREVLTPDAEVLGWNHVPLRFMFLRALIARRLGVLCDAAFPEARIGLLRPEVPSQFYFDSFLVAEAFASTSPRFRLVDGYDTVLHRVEGVPSQCYDFEWLGHRLAQGVDALTHLPTVWSHRAQFVGEVMRRYPRSVDLPSPLWDLPVSTERCPLRPIQTAQITPELRVFELRVAQRVNEALQDLGCAPAAREAQAAELAAACLQQMLQFTCLRAVLAGRSLPIIVTEHDTGMVGPLFSLAHLMQAPVTVVPHSSYPTQPLPHAFRVTALEREGFGSTVRTVIGERVRTRAVRVTPHRAIPVRERIGSVCLLVNTLSGRGISHIDLSGLVGLYRSLERVCRGHGILLKVRLKPGAALLDVSAPALGCDRARLQATLDEPLEQLAARTDVCVAFGELSSGLIDFLEAGALAVHASDESRSTDLINASALSTLHSLDSLQPEEVPAWLEGLLRDPVQYVMRCRLQRAEFDARRLPAADRFID